jgi:predicted aconitase with swiveling domain
MRGTPLVAGRAAGDALVLDQPLSFWGGLDPGSGRIIDARHPQHGENVAGRVLVMSAGRGSSSSTTVLAEAIRLGTSPVAILLARADVIIVVGVLAAADLYGRVVPVVQLPAAELASIPPDAHVRVDADGSVDLTPRQPEPHNGSGGAP